MIDISSLDQPLLNMEKFTQMNLPWSSVCFLAVLTGGLTSCRLQEQCCLFVAEDTVLCLHDIMYAALECIFKNRTKSSRDRSYYLFDISN